MVRKNRVAKFIVIIFLSILSIGTIGCSPKEMKEVDKCWDIYSRKTDLKETIEYGRFIVNKYPKNVSAYRCLADAYYDAGYFKEAYNTIEKAVEIAENKWDISDSDEFYHPRARRLHLLQASDELQKINRDIIYLTAKVVGADCSDLKPVERLKKPL